MKTLKELFEAKMESSYNVGDKVKVNGKKGVIRKIAGQTVHVAHAGEIIKPYKMSEIGEVRK